MMTRQRFLLSALGGALAVPKPVLKGAPAGEPFAPWRPGGLDIHHISTGRGNSTLFVLPDGTTMMVDAGAISAPLTYTIKPRPDASRRPGQWIARYAQRHLKAAQRDAIDYFLLTHFHGDHMGQVSPESPKSKDGSYVLTGISDVADVLPIGQTIDRDYPAYSYPAPLTDASTRNYISFVKSRLAKGQGTAAKIQVGSADQVKLLRQPQSFPTFSVRNLAANGEVWTGVGDATRQLFPKPELLLPDQLPSENMCCLAIRLSYGKFDYYTGGDLTGSNNAGEPAWRDIESPVARVAGPVEVAILNHHGYVDSIGAEYVRSLRPRAFILMAWDSAHPAISTLSRMLNKTLYPGERDIFATALMPENKIVNRRLAELKSDDGHVVVRVAPGGNEFRIVILDNSDESDRVKAEFGPYPCT
jgi:hypothetical protein